MSESVQSVGTVIGDRYRLIAKIGEGGMAEVWEAEHVTLGSRLAVKFMHRSGPRDGEGAQRFLREARVAASVRHRNLVEITDFGFTGNDVPYMVMELLRGTSLSAYLDAQGALEFEDAARLVSLALRGLSAVHDAGIVHRDLKPDNIFLIDDEDGVYPKLLDFGLSRRAGRTDMTMEGVLMGTPDYMSPEQARGAADLDARTDIYSMGVIFYELITGRMPHESELVGDLLAMIARDPATPVHIHRPDAPAALVEIIETAMSKDREQRFPNARDMRIAIHEVFDVWHEPASGLTSLSEMPPPGEGRGSGMLQRPTPPRRTTPSRRGPSEPSATPARPSVNRAHGSREITQPDLREEERLSLGEAPTLAVATAAPASASMPLAAPLPQSAPPPARSSAVVPGLLAATLALSGALAMGSVWLSSEGEGVLLPSFGASSDAVADGGVDDAGVDAGQDAGVDAGRDAGVDAGQDAGQDAAIEDAGRAPPTKRRRGRRPRRRR